MDYPRPNAFIARLSARPIWALAAIPLLIAPAAYMLRADDGNTSVGATIGAMLADPLSVFAARSPGARGAGALTQTKHAYVTGHGQRERLAIGARPQTLAVPEPLVESPQPGDEAPTANPTQPVSVPPEPVSAPVAADAVQGLTDIICLRLKPLGTQAKGSMLEAMIVYEVSQSTLSVEQKALALTKLSQTCPMAGLNYVIGGIDRALQSGALNGTAGLNDGYGMESSYFTAPIVTLGGGSVNYKPGS